MNNVMAVILAGGKGSRLEPLTRDRAKPAVPFGGIYRIIDFALSNCLNSGIRKALVLTQYKAMSLDRHVNLGWRHYFCRELGEFIDVVPPQQRIDEHWYQGTADAVYQNIYALEKERPSHVVILAGDHIYKMNYRKMLDYHISVGADLTIGALEVDLESGRQFGIMQVNEHDRIVGFEEKPAQPKTVPGRTDVCLASMGIYIFSSRVLFELLCRDANIPYSTHDFGRDIIPSIIGTHKVYAYPFTDENGKRQAYWRDVGTLDAYYAANMDLISVEPQLNLYDQQWPVRTYQLNVPPPKFVFGSDGETSRIGHSIDSVVCAGSIISGASVYRSIVGPQVRINDYTEIHDSILFDRVQIGHNVKMKRTIVDKNVCIPDNVEIGIDLELDRRRGFTVTDEGVVVIAKGDRISTESQQTQVVTE